MTDRAGRFTGFPHLADKRLRQRIGPQRIRIPTAARENAGVVVGHLGLIEKAVDLEPAGVFHEPDCEYVGGALRRKTQAERRMKFANAR